MPLPFFHWNNHLLHWVGFFTILLAVLLFDLGLLKRGARIVSMAESLRLSALYVIISLGFGYVLFHYIDPGKGKDFFTAYVIEKSLSMDNIFIISLIFGYFKIPREHQQRALFWGILGALVLRGAMIGGGLTLVHFFHHVLYFFGAFLVVSGIRMLFVVNEGKQELEHNPLLHWLKNHLPLTPDFYGDKFLIKESGAQGQLLRKATPLLLALILIELADIVFAVDSVPAVFAVTTDPFVVYSSNIFAVMGLRALYFTFSVLLHRFIYLKYALALVLVFIGGKIFFPHHITSLMSLSVTLSLLVAGALLSLYKTRGKPDA